jgi:membrane protease YdiL (CAAX protease family)
VGQAANGDYAQGAVHAGLYLVLANAYLDYLERDDYLRVKEREVPGTNDLLINRTTANADLVGTAALNLAFYSAFGAYRDARGQPEYAGTYRTPAPEEGLGELALAPFRLRYLSRPTTYIPLLLPLYAALARADSEALLYRPDDSINRSELAQRFFVMHEMVAVGEEAFFRGFLNNGLSDKLGPGWGLIASSTIFGLGHSGDGAQATAIGAALFGGYLGWLQQQNDYAISEGVTIHFWWNFFASLALLRERESETARVVPFSFHLRF